MIRPTVTVEGRRGLAPATVVGGALLTVLAAYFIGPVIWLIVAMTKSTYELFHLPIFTPASWAQWIHNLVWLSTFQGGIFWTWMANSAFYSVVGAGVGTLLAAFTAYPLAKLEFRGRAQVAAVIIGALMVPGAVLVIPQFMLEQRIGMLNTYWGVLLPTLPNAFGVYFLMTYTAQAVPDALLDAARIDGASPLRIFFQIVLPLLTPGLTTLGLIMFVGIWNNFFLPLVLLSNQSLFPVTLGLYQWVEKLNQPGVGVPLYPLVLVGAFISVAPLLLLFPILQRYVTSGLTLGGLQG